MMPFLFTGDAGGRRLCGLSEPFARVAAGGDLGAPRPVGDEPVDRLREAALEGLHGAPSELALELPAVDRVPAVVARAVRDELDLARMGRPVLARRPCVQERADELHGLQVGPL